MGREKEAYRDNVERLKEMFPSKELLNIKDVIAFTGASRKTVAKRYPFKDGWITIATLARAMS